MPTPTKSGETHEELMNRSQPEMVSGFIGIVGEDSECARANRVRCSSPQRKRSKVNLNPKLEDYTEAEFTQLVGAICSAEGGEAYQDKLLENFISVSEHPDGSDLIYYSEGDNATPAKIVASVKSWRKANGKNGFKS